MNKVLQVGKFVKHAYNFKIKDNYTMSDLPNTPLNEPEEENEYSNSQNDNTAEQDDGTPDGTENNTTDHKEEPQKTQIELRKQKNIMIIQIE